MPKVEDELSDENKKLVAVLKAVFQPQKAEKVKTHVPYESLVGKNVEKPILDEEIMNVLREAIAPLKARKTWEKWGMDRYDKFGTTLLFTGPSGTGKTTAARWLAKEVSGGFINISMADVGGAHPGDTERSTKAIFEEAKKQGNCTIHIDECDALLWSRDKAGADSMWMLGVINGFLQQIESFQGLTIMSTNLPAMLDPALKRRITETIEFPLPDILTRRELWLQKTPLALIQLNEAQTNKLAQEKLTGAEIERAIEKEARVSIRERRSPKFDSLLSCAAKIAAASGRSS